MSDIIEYIKQATEESEDMKYRTISVEQCTIQIVYNEATTDSEFISGSVIRSIKGILQEYFKSNMTKTFEKWQINEVVTKIKNELNAVNTVEIYRESSDLFYYLFSGFTLLIIEDKILAVETRGHVDRTISEAQIESDVKGPKDAFVENYVQNLGLIRKRIKTEKLVLKENKLGRRSKTKVGILYLSDVADVESTKKIEEEIKKIDIDGILDSNYVREIMLSKGDSTVFPTVISTERPDVVAYNLLEGRIAIIVENSPFALVFPAFFVDFFKSMDDYYQLNKNITLTRILRYVAFFITLLLPALYVSLITFNHEVIPSDLLVSFTVQRDGVPAPAFLEALLMILAFEILRESDYRVPSMAGSALSIVGALILRRCSSNSRNSFSDNDYSYCNYEYFCIGVYRYKYN